MSTIYGESETEDCKQMKIKRDILNSVTKATWGLTIDELSEQTHYHRNTVSKYLMILEAMGVVDYKTYGKTKVWFPSNSTLELRAKMPQIVLTEMGKALRKRFPKEAKEIIYELAKEVALKSTEELKKASFPNEKFNVDVVINHICDFHPILLGQMNITPEKKGEKWVVHAKGCYCHGDPEFEEGCMITAGGIAGIIEALVGKPIIVQKTNHNHNDKDEICSFVVKVKESAA